MKAIETIYNGYKFRSRLEARWAVFFDYFKIKYEYEKEGFELENGRWYLPDFYIESWNSYIEIKPSSAYQDSWESLRELISQFEKQLLIIIGNPYPKDYSIVMCNEKIQCYDKLVFALSFNREMHLVRMNPDRNTYFLGIALEKYKSKGRLHWPYISDDEKIIIEYNESKILYDAYKKARQARFEHGEKKS